MNHTYRVLMFGVLAIVLASCASKPAVQPEPSPRPRGAETGRVEVTVKGFESEEGQALIALFLSDSGWPQDKTSAFATLMLPIHDRQVVAVFEAVPAGPFAISVFHDKNSNRELDTGPLGIPSESYGFSRDARDTLGPPSFAQARLELGAGESMSLVIHVE